MRGMGDLDRRYAGALLAHHGARGSGDLVNDGDIARQQVGQLRQKKGGTQFGGQFLVEATAPGRCACGLPRRSACRRWCRVRRRRPPRSCPSSCRTPGRPSGRRRQAPGRRHRRRGVASFPSGADRRGAESAPTSRSREADAPCRGANRSLSTLATGGRAAGQGVVMGLTSDPERGHQADAGYHHLMALVCHCRSPVAFAMAVKRPTSSARLRTMPESGT